MKGFPLRRLRKDNSSGYSPETVSSLARRIPTTPGTSVADDLWSRECERLKCGTRPVFFSASNTYNHKKTLFWTNILRLFWTNILRLSCFKLPNRSAYIQLHKARKCLNWSNVSLKWSKDYSADLYCPFLTEDFRLRKSKEKQTVLATV